MQISKRTQYNMISFALILTIVSGIAFIAGMTNFRNYDTILNMPMAISAVAFLYNFISYLSFQKTENKCCDQEYPASLLVSNFIILALHFLCGAILAIAHL